MLELTSKWPFGLTRRNWPDRLALILLVLFVLVFFDVWVSQTLTAWPQTWRAAFDFVTGFGLSEFVLIPTAVICVVSAAALWLLRGRQACRIAWELTLVSGFVFLATGIPGLLANILKRLVGRARPMEFGNVGIFQFHGVINDWNFQSFPSGHSTTAMATAVVIGFMAPRFFRLFLLIAVATGMSRVVVGMHYPTDVIAGFIMGTLGAYAVRNNFVRRRWLFSRTPDGRVRFRGLPNLHRVVRRMVHRALP